MNAASGDMNGIPKFTIYVVDHTKEKHKVIIDAANACYPDRLTPACTIVPLTQLGTDPDMLLEIEALGVLKSEDET